MSGFIGDPKIKPTLTVSSSLDTNECPYCGESMAGIEGGQAHKGDRYEWRAVFQCPNCGLRREEITSLPLSSVYGKEG